MNSDDAVGLRLALTALYVAAVLIRAALIAVSVVVGVTVLN